MATFSQLKKSLNEMSEKTMNGLRASGRALDLLTSEYNNLDAMPSAYQTIVAEIDQLAIDNPGNALYENLKAEKDLLVQDFLNAKTSVGNARDAIAPFVI